MFNIHRLLFLLIFLVIASRVISQTNTDSPYSRYGLGDLEREGIGSSKAMGGTGIGLRLPNQINLLNPAACTTQDTLSFLFDFGLSINRMNYKTSSLTSSNNNVAFTHLVFGFPITKWWYAFMGATPFSSVGYDTKIEAPRQNNVDPVNYFYKGSGGLNKYFLGTAIKWKNLSMGLNANYVLGTLKYQNKYEFPLDATFFSTGTTNNFVVKGIVLGLGAQYTINLNEQSNVVLGTTFDPRSKLNANKNSYTLEYTGSFDQPTLIDSANNVTGKLSKIVLPAKIGFGASFNLKKKLAIGFDYTTQNWTKYEFDGIKDSLTRSNSFNFGLHYIPNYQAIRGYFRRVNYNIGAYYTNTYLTLRGQNLKEYGVSVGIGLPSRNNKSILHITYEIGQRGTLTNNLVRETYQYIYLSLSLYDFWFIKAKYD